MLLNLINDLLDLAKQEKLTFQLDKHFFDLSESIQSAFKTLEFLSKKKKIETNLNIEDPELFSDLYGDKNRFEQIFINFISNALKFTHEGGKVEVDIKSKQLTQANQVEIPQDNQAASDAESPSSRLLYLQRGQNDPLFYNEFVIQIKDNGTGISKEGIRNLFIDFSSLREHHSSNQRGTGLGLSICKQIIEKMGGDVKVVSEVGEGTTFIISLTTLCKVQRKCGTTGTN